LDLEKKLELIKKPPTEEIITEKELIELLQTNPNPVAYDGFEPSGN
jgi:tyrosyl-tRNA synthetase